MLSNGQLEQSQADKVNIVNGRGAVLDGTIDDGTPG